MSEAEYDDHDILSELDGVLKSQTDDTKSTPEKEDNKYDIIDLNQSVNKDILPNGVLMGEPTSSTTSSSPEHGLSTNPQLDKVAKLYERYSVQCTELERVETQNSEYREQLLTRIKEKDGLEHQIIELKQTHSNKLQEIERKALETDYHLKACKDRMAAQEQHFRRSMAEFHTRTSAQIEQLKKSSETAQREKDVAVIKYAQRESEILNLEKARNDLGEQLKQTTKERDALNARLRGSKNEKENVIQSLDSKESEMMDLRNELERTRSYIKEAEIRVKVGNKRVEDVEAAHKETKTELEQVQKLVSGVKEESATFRADYQNLIGQFQDSQEKKAAELQIQLQEQSDIKEIYAVVVNELDAVKKQHRTTLKETEELRIRVNELEEKCIWTERELENERTTRAQEQTRLEQLSQTAACVQSATQDAEAARLKMLEAEEDKEQAEKEASQCRIQAERMLELTEQLTAKNSQLTTENLTLNTQVGSLENDNVNLNERCSELAKRFSELEHKYGELKACSSAEVDSLRQQLSDNVKREQQLATQVEDEKSENKVLKKKHIASVKELRSELSSMKRRLNSYETGAASLSAHSDSRDSQPERNGGSGPSMSSRASSITSLDATQNNRLVEVPSPLGTLQGDSEHETIPTQTTSTNEQPHTCHHNQAMIEKIVKLQRANARRTEKIEFLEEHVRQLTEELRKKTKIIQMYAVREEAGALAPETIDFNRFHDSQSEVLKRGVFGMNRRTVESKITLDLAMEINSKLQAVLEDTLTKNMAFKDNVETLGQEISRLSRENRDLRLKPDHR